MAGAGGVGQVASGLGGLFGPPAPAAQQQYYGGSEGALEDIRDRNTGAINSGLDNTTAYFQGGTASAGLGSLVGTPQSQQFLAQQQQAALQAAGGIGRGPESAVQNQFLGNALSNASTMAGQQVVRDAGQRAQAVGATLGGAAGARAAAQANGHAAVEGARIQALTAAQERIGLANAQNNAQAIVNQRETQRAQLLGGLATQQGNLAVNAAGQIDSSRGNQAQLALGQTGQFLGAQDAAENAQTQNNQMFYQQQLAAQQAKAQQIGNLIGGGASLAAGGAGMLG